MLTASQLTNILHDGAAASTSGAECLTRLAEMLSDDPFQIPGLLVDGRACDVSLAMLSALLERRIQADLAMVQAMVHLRNVVHGVPLVGGGS